ncbi:MAG: hypothetical protein WDN45_14510 [Caulobacteraceae bacterium]
MIGDVTSGPMLAHKAEDEAVACIELIAGKGRPCELRHHPLGDLHLPGRSPWSGRQRRS